MEDEKSFIQEFEKLNEETKQMINKYNNAIYENKITDGKEITMDTFLNMSKRGKNLE